MGRSICQWTNDKEIISVRLIKNVGRLNRAIKSTGSHSFFSSQITRSTDHKLNQNLTRSNIISIGKLSGNTQDMKVRVVVIAESWEYGQSVIGPKESYEVFTKEV